METMKILGVTRRNDITFHRSGRIDLTAHVSKVLHLHAGDVINIAATGGPIVEHYLYVARRGSETTGRHCGVCRPAKRRGNYLRVFCKRLTDYALSTRSGASSVALRVGQAEEVSGLGTALPIIGLF